MKRILSIILIAAVITSCASNKNYLERNDADKALLDAVKKLNKSSTDEKATAAVPVLYNTIQQNHLAKIKAYSNSTELSRWDKIIHEYEFLQDAYDAIINSTPAFKLITPQSYSANLLESKQKAADEYYAAGLELINNSGRDNAKKAYSYFKKSDKFIPGFKEAAMKMQQAFENAIVDVVINPVQDNSFFYNSGWGNSMSNYSNQYFQETLVKDLSSLNSNRYPARFYTDWQVRRDNIQPDWAVDLKLRNMDIPQPTYYTYRRNASAQIEEGRDTSGRPIYRTVYATLNITRESFTARADMEVNIKDLSTQKNISYNSFREEYRWEEERATYNGDSRALNSNDWNLINNSGYFAPRREQILEELYRKIYPKVKNQISYTADW